MALRGARRAALLASALLAGQPGGAGAYPLELRHCEAWASGGYGVMMSGLLGNGAGGDCTIDITVPSAGIVPGEVYEVTVKSKEPALYKLYSTDGQCLGSSYEVAQLAPSETFKWKAPKDGKVALHALCGRDFMTVFAAPAVNLTSAQALAQQAAPRPAGAGAAPGAPAPGAASEAPAPPPAALAPFRMVQLDEGLMLTFLAAPSGRSGEGGDGDGVTLQVDLDRPAWLGIGVSEGGCGDAADGHGKGVDFVVCEGGLVGRHLLANETIPSAGAGAAIVGASCAQRAGGVVLAFTRAVAAAGPGERSVTPGTPQRLHFVVGEAGDWARSRGAARRGAVVLDFATGLGAEQVCSVGRAA